MTKEEGILFKAEILYFYMLIFAQFLGIVAATPYLKPDIDIDLLLLFFVVCWPLCGYVSNAFEAGINKSEISSWKYLFASLRSFPVGIALCVVFIKLEDTRVFPVLYIIFDSLYIYYWECRRYIKRIVLKEETKRWINSY